MASFYSRKAGKFENGNSYIGVHASTGGERLFLFKVIIRRYLATALACFIDGLRSVSY